MYSKMGTDNRDKTLQYVGLPVFGVYVMIPGVCIVISTPSQIASTQVTRNKKEFFLDFLLAIFFD